MAFPAPRAASLIPDLTQNIGQTPNNVAVLVARQVSGSVASFVADMNRTARAHHRGIGCGQAAGRPPGAERSTR
jgi:hypothetical protein